MKKVYIRYCRPFKDDNDEPPIEEIWSDGARPKKKLANDGLTYVYDEDPENAQRLINDRIWDGIE